MGRLSVWGAGCVLAKRETSAGGVVESDGKFLIIEARSRRGNIYFGFPKGHVEEGETKEMAAVREVLEEGGYVCQIRESLGKTVHCFDDVEKTIFWFLMTPLKETELKDPDGAIISRTWMNKEAALKILTHGSERKLLKCRN